MPAQPGRALDLRKLSYFVAVAEELHFGRAAQRLFIAQSVLSRQVRLLEEELGVELLTRTSRSVALTPAGAGLLEDGRELLALAEAARHRAAVAGRERLTLTIGFWGVERLAETIRRFRAEHPQVETLLHRVSWDTQEEVLRRGVVDVLFAVLPIDQRGLELVPFSSERRHATLPSAHPAAGRAELRIDDLRDEPVIVHGGATPEWQAFHSVDPRPDGRHPVTGPVANDYQVKLELVAAGQAISFLPERSIATNPWPGVSYVPVADIPPLEMCVAWDARSRSPLVDDFVALFAPAAA